MNTQPSRQTLLYPQT